MEHCERAVCVQHTSALCSWVSPWQLMKFLKCMSACIRLPWLNTHLWSTYYVHVPDAVLNAEEASQNRTDTCPSVMKANAAESEGRMECKF